MGGDSSNAGVRAKLAAFTVDARGRLPCGIGDPADRWKCNNCNAEAGTDINKLVCRHCRAEGTSNATARIQLKLCNEQASRGANGNMGSTFRPLVGSGGTKGFQTKGAATKKAKPKAPELSELARLRAEVEKLNREKIITAKNKEAAATAALAADDQGPPCDDGGEVVSDETLRAALVEAERVYKCFKTFADSCPGHSAELDRLGKVRDEAKTRLHAGKDLHTQSVWQHKRAKKLATELEKLQSSIAEARQERDELDANVDELVATAVTTLAQKAETDRIIQDLKERMSPQLPVTPTAAAAAGLSSVQLELTRITRHEHCTPEFKQQGQAMEQEFLVYKALHDKYIDFMARAAPSILAAEKLASASVAAAVPTDSSKNVAGDITDPTHGVAADAGTAQSSTPGLPAAILPAATPATPAATPVLAASPAATPSAPSSGPSFVHKRPPPESNASGTDKPKPPNYHEYSLERLCAEQNASKTARLENVTGPMVVDEGAKGDTITEVL